jgi:hypothetical protein
MTVSTVLIPTVDGSGTTQLRRAGKSSLDGSVAQAFEGSTVQLSATPTMQAAAYVTGNVIGGLISLANAVRAPGSGLIQSVTVTFQSGVEPSLDIVFFDGNPTNSTITDKTAIALAAADLGSVAAVAHLSDWTLLAASTMAFGQAQTITQPFAIPSGTTLYAAVVSRSSVTLGATNDMQISVNILQD